MCLECMDDYAMDRATQSCKRVFTATVIIKPAKFEGKSDEEVVNEATEALWEATGIRGGIKKWEAVRGRLEVVLYFGTEAERDAFLVALRNGVARDLDYISLGGIASDGFRSTWRLAVLAVAAVFLFFSVK